MDSKTMWRLERIGFEDNVVYLNQGKTTVGRSLQSAIILDSVYCSRDHCAFIVNETNDISILDKSSNGVFVNGTHYLKQEVKLEENFIIGIGCSIDNNFKENPNFYIYKLKKKKLFNEINNNNNNNDDDDNADKMKINLNDNIAVKVEDIMDAKCLSDNQNDIKKEVIDISDTVVKSLSPCVDYYNEEDNKNSIQIFDVSRDYDDDDIINILSDDEDEDENATTLNWMAKLSQSFLTPDKIKREKKMNENFDISDISDAFFDDEAMDQLMIKSEKASRYLDEVTPIKTDLNIENDCKNKDEIIDINDSGEEISSDVSTNSDYRFIKECSVVIEEIDIPKKSEKKKAKKKVTKFSDIKVTSSKPDEREKIINKIRSICDSDSESDIDMNEIRKKRKRSSQILELSNEDSDYTTAVTEKTIHKPILAVKKPVTKVPLIIDAPFLPKRRLSMSRRLSMVESPKAAPSEKSSTPWMAKPGTSKNKEIIKRNVIASCRKEFTEKSLKDKWKSVKRKSINLSDDKKEDRRKKLKEIASTSGTKEELPKKKLVKPKVKVTEQNRGSFLVDDTIFPLVKPKSVPVITRKEIIQTNNTDDKKEIANEEKINVPIKSNFPTMGNVPVSYPRVKKLRFSDIEISIDTKSTLPSPIPTLIPTPIPQITTDNHDIIVSKKPNKLLPVIKVTSIKLKSCLKSLLPIRKTPCHVKFNESPVIRYYQIDEGNSLNNQTNQKDAPMPRKIADYAKQQQYHNQFKQEKIEIVINSITSWKPLWLKQNWPYNSTPPVNGDNHTIVPILHCFNNINSYISNFTPLMNIELFKVIQEKSKFEAVIWDNMRIMRISEEARGNHFRYMYHCKAPLLNKDKNPMDGDLIVVEFFDEMGTPNSFFAYCVGIRWDIINKIIICTFESSVTNFSKEFTMKSQIKTIRKIMNIKNELYLFLSVFNLDSSLLVNHILKPLDYIKLESTNQNINLVTMEPLNYVQKNIITQVYGQCVNSVEPKIMLIEGPPGTGKSRLITNLIMQLRYGSETKNGIKILLCAPSNNAVDLIALKLSSLRSQMNVDKIKLVRFGIFDKMDDRAKKISCQTFAERIACAEYKKLSTENHSNLTDEFNFLKEMIRTFEQLKDITNIQKEELKNHRNKFAKINNLLNCPHKCNPEFYRRYKIAQNEILAGADVVCTTLSSCSNLRSFVTRFDVCIIDEASQCTEPMSLLPLQFGVNKLILVGDTYQLPATIVSKIAQDNGLGNPLFSRICSCYKNNTLSPILFLNQQYRMHPDICYFPNFYFYNNRLINDPSCVDNNRNFPLKPYLIFSLNYFQKNSMKQTNSSDSRNSIHNQNEADFVINLVKKLIVVADPKKYNYGIITPYVKQKTYLKHKLDASIGDNSITVNTIDSYQGQERDIIIISTVRTDGIGFLNNFQRLNVSLTRAKKCLIICGNFVSLKESNSWKSLLDDAYRRKVIREINDSTSNKYDVIHDIKKL